MSTTNSSTKNFIRGGQITLHNFRMFTQIANRVIALGIGLFFLFLLLWIFTQTHPYERYILGQWGLAQFYIFLDGSHAKQAIIEPNGKEILAYSQVLINSPLMQLYLSKLIELLIAGVLFSLAASLSIIYAISYFLKKYGNRHTQNKRIKGDYLSTPELVKKHLYKIKKASDLTLGSTHLPMVKDAEKQHFLFDGTTGSGKSNAIKEILTYIRNSGDRAIIFDEGGYYLREFYQPETDKLLNALDERGRSWHLWDECQDVAAFENLAASLIPMIGVQDPFWVLGARTIFSEVAFSMRRDKERNVQKLLQMLLTASLDNIKEHLQHTFAAILASDKIEKTAISIKSVMAAYLKCLRYVKDEKNAFSIRRWIQNESTPEWLFISSVEKKHEALKPLITAWLDIAINELLSLPENPLRRIWLILDELTSLHKIPSLFKVLAKSRKPGGCVVIGIQNYAQLAEVYGVHGAQTISSLLNTRFIFRQPDPDMAAWSARNLGETTLEEVREGLSYGANTMRDGISINRVEIRKPVVSFSEIMVLDDLKCYLRLPGDLPITRLTYDYTERENINAPFIERNLEGEGSELDALIASFDKPQLRGMEVQTVSELIIHSESKSKKNNPKKDEITLIDNL